MSVHSASLHVPRAIPGPGRCAAPRGLRLAERLRLGALTSEIPPELVDEVLERTGRVQQRRRVLPARAVVYFVLALCLFNSAESAGPPGYRAVLRAMAHGLRHLPELAGGRLPTSCALTRARQRLGDKPMQALFEHVCGARAAARVGTAFAFGLRVVAWDGTALDVPDTPANAAAFGFASANKANQGSNPQVRLMALIECGTHALLDAAFDAIAHHSEHALSRRLLASLDATMLLLADRNFPGYELWGQARATGAHLVWRLKKQNVFDPLRVLPDGSFLAIMRTPADNVKYGQARAAGRTLPATAHGHLVRIIQYTATIHPVGAPAQVEAYRLVTSLLDHRLAPAGALAALYHQRWGATRSRTS